MACMKTFQFSAAVRGYHYYKRFWIPEPEQVLKCSHKVDNAFDLFAIKVCKTPHNETVGDLTMEISRVTKFLKDRGAEVTAKLTSTHYRRSPLVQGGLEISCLVTVTMPGTVLNQLLIERFQQLVAEKYVEPKNEEIIGCVLNVEAIDEALNFEPKKKKKKKPANKPTNTQHQDIRNFFTANKHPGINQEK